MSKSEQNIGSSFAVWAASSKNLRERCPSSIQMLDTQLFGKGGAILRIPGRFWLFPNNFGINQWFWLIMFFG